MGGFFMGFDSCAHKRSQAHKRTLTRLKREGVPAPKRKPIKK